MKFYRCEQCGNMVGVLKESGVPMICCGQHMKEVLPATSDGAVEKHVPVFRVDGNRVTVKIGAAVHPMMQSHFIEWIALDTVKGAQRKELAPGEEPCVTFVLTEDDAVLAVYAYCNLHGLWKADRAV